MSDIKNLEQEVQNTGMGIMDPKKLEMLFGSGTPSSITPQQPPAEPVAPTPQSAPAVQPTPAPAPAPVEPTPQPAPASAPVEPVRTEPNVMELIPAKFHDKDLVSSVQKVTKSYADLEAELQKQRDENAQMNKLVQSLTQQAPQSQPQPQPAQAPEDDVSDTTFWEKPKDSAVKIASKVAAAQILAYHELQERVRFVEAFKTSHPDFEAYREDMMAILRSRPDLDKDYHNLPIVYEASKKRHSQRLEEMKSQMGLASSPAPAPAPQINIEEIEKRAYEKARKAIQEELQQRQSATGIMGSSPATSPDARVATQPSAQPKSAADIVIDEMLAAGPKKFLPEL